MGPGHKGISGLNLPVDLQEEGQSLILLLSCPTVVFPRVLSKEL